MANPFSEHISVKILVNNFLGGGGRQVYLINYFFSFFCTFYNSMDTTKNNKTELVPVTNDIKPTSP